MIPLSPPTPDPAGAAAAAARFLERHAGRADVGYRVLDTPIGEVVLAATRRGLARVAYTDFAGGVDAVLDDLAAGLSPGIVEDPRRLDAVARELDQYFAGRRTAFDVPIDWALTRGFGRRVLQATAALGFGETASYREVAEQAGNVRATRAAGNALGHNPMPIVVPCHRVLRTGGGLGGYTGGLFRKEHLLTLEGVLVG